jgi:hypothetical protein
MKLKEKLKTFEEIVQNVEQFENNGYKLVDVPVISSYFNLRKHIASNNDGYWEGFDLRIDDLGFEITYLKKLEKSSTKLTGVFWSKEFKEIIDFEQKMIELGKQF